jgi:hypothetical protein
MHPSEVCRSSAVGFLLVAAMCLLSAGFCERLRALEAQIEEPEVATGHDRMLVLLGEIQARTDEDNHWLGDRGARLARRRLADLEGSSDDLLRFRRLIVLAEEELRLGNENESISHFEEAYALLPRLREKLDLSQAARSVFRLGVAYLRLGESENCAVRHTAESCILPIRGAGVHVDQRGSREAIRRFEEVLAIVPASSPLHIKTLWLLNIAYMTIDGYPESVPEAYRIPPAVFASGRPFPRLRNVAPAVGIQTFNLSGGAVVDDFDGDDDLDILTTTFDSGGEPHYLRNEGDGRFTDRTKQAGLEGLYGGLNVVQADYDNDGDLDVYVLRGAWLYSAGRHPNSLWRNDGHGRFVDVTFEAGLGDRHLPSQTASWADYDNDGDVDLFVGNEHGADPDVFGDVEAEFEAPCQLFRNNGPGADGTVTFTDVASEAGVDVRAYVKGVIWGDYDDDRDPDLYISVLGGSNFLFRNNGIDDDGRVTFTDVAAGAGVDGPISSFPVWFWDYDNDGRLDLYVSSYAGARDSVSLVAASYFGQPVPYDLARLYRGSGDGRFEDVASSSGLERLHLTMGSNFGDLDNDGYLDFYLGTGYPDYEGLMPNVLYHNEGGRRFADVTLDSGMGHLQKGHAVSFADYDLDGDLDVFEQMGGAYPGDRFPDALFQNPGFGNRWLTLHLIGVRSNRAAIGARIRVEVLEKGQRRSIYRRVNSGGSFGCNPLRQTIGLGPADAIERLEIYWPTSDIRQTFSTVPMDAFLRVTEGSDELVRFGPGFAN